jgi:hypothetical protein
MAQKQKTRWSYAEDRHLIQLAASSNSLEAIADEMSRSALAGKVEREMLDNGASLFVCRYSDEPFNTAEIIGPHWSEIPSHVPSAAVFLGLPLTIMGCG